MRDKLQALVEQWRNQHAICNANGYLGKTYYDDVADELESILATTEPTVTLKPGWIAKDSEALWWFRKKPTWGETIYGDGWSDPDFHVVYLDDSVVDPWEKLHPNGGPECCMEVK